MICNSYKRNPDSTGPELVPCACKPLRVITWQDVTGDCISGYYCARHAIELRRDEAKGRLEILSDEPVEIPFQGEPVAGPERTMAEFYGV